MELKKIFCWNHPPWKFLDVLFICIVYVELDIDQSILSKIERGERKASKKQIIQIAKIFNVQEKELLINYLSDQVLYELMDNEDLATDALKIAEKKIKYRNKNKNEK